MLQKPSDLVLKLMVPPTAPDDCRLPEIITASRLTFQAVTQGISGGHYSQRRHTAD